MTIEELKEIIKDMPDNMDIVFIAKNEYGNFRHKISDVSVSTVETVEGDIDVAIIR